MKFPFLKKRKTDTAKVLRVRVFLPKSPSTKSQKPRIVMEPSQTQSPETKQETQSPSPTSIRDTVLPLSVESTRDFVMSLPTMSSEEEKEEETSSQWSFSYTPFGCGNRACDASSEGETSDDSDDVKNGLNEIMKIISMYMEDFREKYGIECPTLEEVIEDVRKNYPNEWNQLGLGSTSSTDEKNTRKVTFSDVILEKNPVSGLWNNEQNFDSIYEQGMIACTDMSMCAEPRDQRKDFVISMPRSTTR